MTKRAERFVFSTSTKIFKPNMKQMNHNSPYAIVAHRSYRALVLVDFTKLTSCFTASLSVFFCFFITPGLFCHSFIYVLGDISNSTQPRQNALSSEEFPFKMLCHRVTLNWLKNSKFFLSRRRFAMQTSWICREQKGFDGNSKLRCG